MKLLDYLPRYYENSAEVVAVQAAIDPAVAQAQSDWETLLLQLNVQTATWGLELWERALEIALETEKPPEYRRTRIISKLRGQGTTTAAMIQNVAESFSNGQVDVLEFPAEYRFDVKFTGTIGTPPNMGDLTVAIEEIKPAHLAYAYIILFRTWAELKTKTWSELKAHTWGEIKGGSIV